MSIAHIFVGINQIKPGAVREETMSNTITTVEQWREHMTAHILEYDKKDSFYLTIPKEKIGALGGASTNGYIAKYTPSWGDMQPKYSYCRELRNLFQSWQWHTCFASDINKRLKKDEAKYRIYETTDLQKAINFVTQ